jgi:hypothetical protein
MCVSIFCTTSTWNISHSKKNLVRYFLKILSKNTQISNSIKIRPVGAELFHADGRADMANLTVVFRNFANVPKE